jgi:hypothetical protein
MTLEKADHLLNSSVSLSVRTPRNNLRNAQRIFLKFDVGTAAKISWNVPISVKVGQKERSIYMKTYMRF